MLAPLFEQLLEKYPESVKVVFKNYPLPFHKYAGTAAVAAFAAARQGRFWEFHDLLFQYSKVLNPQRIEDIARETGLDMDTYRRDATSPDTRSKIEKDIRDGKEAGVNGTPTLFINGRRVKNRTLSEMQSMIDRELARIKIKEKELD